MTAKTVLIVDDDPSLYDNLKDILENEGYEPFFAGTCHDGLKLTRERRAKVALLDLKLPDGQGTTLLSDLKRENPGVCIIMTDPEKFGFHAVILKPYTMNELGKILHEVIISIRKYN